jgi:hypothetical protein
MATLPSLEVMDDQRVVVYGSKMGDEEGDTGGSHCKKCGRACGVLGFIFHVIDAILNPIGWLVHHIAHALFDPCCGKKVVSGVLYILDFCIDPAHLAEDAAEAASSAA